MGASGPFVGPRSPSESEGSATQDEPHGSYTEKDGIARQSKREVISKSALTWTMWTSATSWLHHDKTGPVLAAAATHAWASPLPTRTSFRRVGDSGRRPGLVRRTQAEPSVLLLVHELHCTEPACHSSVVAGGW
jgi:hypothetical protein